MTYRRVIGLANVLDDDSEVPENIKPVRRGGSVDFTAVKNEIYVVAVAADKEVSGGTDIKIFDENGQEAEFTEEDDYYINYDFVVTGDIDLGGGSSVEMEPAQVVQNLSGNKLTYDSVKDGDTLYLLKGGKYTYEDDLNITPYAEGAITLNAKKNLLTAKKDQSHPVFSKNQLRLFLPWAVRPPESACLSILPLKVLLVNARFSILQIYSSSRILSSVFNP